MKNRLDILVTEKGLAASREQAKTMIMAGEIFVNGVREDKAGDRFDDDALIEFHGKTLPYVSRGGLKLEKALKSFPISLAGKTCLDIGASTGGFTDCMLQNGAAKVFAVDVGYGQLAYKLRTDERVVCMEKTNVRYLTPEQLGTKAGFASVDVSFISLKLVLPALYPLLSEDAELVCLVKPQFEAGREKVGKKGVVRDPAVHREVLGEVTSFAAAHGYQVLALDYSPIKGPEGNIEYLMYLRKLPQDASPEGENGEIKNETIRELVRISHESLDAEK
ncbi:MAG: TlyA family RNA methyltransferase [Lachnospiraceae bacterium]|nr:TlyA family RNA methyltransferase [Lachnospiraceae bacterium]